MGKYAVIGLSNFGQYLGRKLHDLGHEVVCLDENEDMIKQAQEYCSYGLVGNATDTSILSSLHVKDLDAVFVCLGDEMSDSILVTLLLKDLEARRIISRISSVEHGRILSAVGADEVIFPERDMAVRVANYVSSPNIMNYLDIDPEYSVLEVAPLPDFIGKSLVETNIRSEYGVNVIAIKDVIQDKIAINPSAGHIIKDSDLLIVIGNRDNLNAFTRVGRNK